MSDEEKLTGKDRLEVAVKAGLQLIPYIGAHFPRFILMQNKNVVSKG